MKDIYHVIGYPVKHSLSPKIQMQLAKEHNQKMLFTAVEIRPEDLENKIAEFKADPQIKGLSVTVPHKERVFELADSADDIAQDVKAASNVIFTEDRQMKALNYDGLGIVNDIKNNHKKAFLNKKVLIVGAGGAAKAVVAAIIKENPSLLSIANRTKAKADAIKKLFQSKYDITIEDYENIKGCYDIVINSTSSSISNKMLPLSTNNFTSQAFGYDLMYAQDGTVFTNWCGQNNITSSDGKGMLEELSKAVFKCWRNIAY
ncbi:shikimate dehydrogenase [Francisella adeliensis]|uniref:shikimate dehydrogenase (NADP(+)) n=1 Tax=Francisella adeliensis TaxID=2007306 RepID=A0A2Z4XW35_9GAMM|nr:shikimate dehydrogenase [Francisella adeliensis]AXA32909.1 shikimate dehydrogenase [Francisella adeliensis]MBK2086408.1 shikimate dehydrogenase [Francisella adeliensis]MBK2096623.1 shikimate dehydrogenase [Francisella adeliensis]QIW11135.1 shikimate dehydrogenase [Francisella adeliensis]QIW13012.1 shikimate dehydrogenase [Francisella adeliensis]